MIGMRSGPDRACHERAYAPGCLLLQWHITERCNLRCAHCYQESYAGDELGYPDLLEVLRQFKELLSLWRGGRRGKPVRGHVTVTGGEPFVRRDFLDLLGVLNANKEFFTFAILTNGGLIDATLARRLRALGPAFVQVSIEGKSATHDRIRGEGELERTVSAVRHLVRADVRTFISFTAHRSNFREFADVARLGRKLQVRRVWADRFIPLGAGSAMSDHVLSPEETREFFEVMRNAGAEAKRRWFNRTEVAAHRALQFLVNDGKPYFCSAGDSLITVQPNGDLFPCRRMPIWVGNLMDTPLVDLYHGSDLFRALRDRDRVSVGCQDCFYARVCRGGLKCLSYAMTGDPFNADPGCWHASKASPGVEGN